MNGQYYDYEKLAAERRAKFTQEQFAKALGITVTSLSRIENGHSASYLNLVKACHLLDLDSQEVLYSSRKLVAVG